MAISAQNSILSGAATDLGMGDALVTQLQDQVAMAKKNKLAAGNAQSAGPLSAAAGSLFASALGGAGQSGSTPPSNSVMSLLGLSS